MQMMPCMFGVKGNITQEPCLCLLQATPLDLLPQLQQQLQQFLGHQRQGQAPRAHPLLEQFHGDSKLLVPLHAIAAAALRVPPAEQPDQQLGRRLQAALMELLAGALLPDDADALAAGGAALAYAPRRGNFLTLTTMDKYACNSGICGACSRSPEIWLLWGARCRAHDLSKSCWL